MIKVLETFSGIGAQAKALKRAKIKYQIIGTADWDINAIVAYDIIHNGRQDTSQYDYLTKSELINKLKKYTLSPNGKSAFKKGKINHISLEGLKSILCAIERTNNQVSITDMTYHDIPDDLDLLTYSFPCQDLSIAGVWHGNMSGIDREANNSSGMLWEIERILKECFENQCKLPRFLLMENVSNILAPRHKKNFKEWENYLVSIGYYNKYYKLNAKNFGIPQIRTRVYMISIFIGDNKKKQKELDEFFKKNNLEDTNVVKQLKLKCISIEDIIKIDYTINKYKKEADLSQLNDTPSRQRIINENDHIYREKTKEYIKHLKTITTKQDRNPNSGVIEYNHSVEGKINYRYLTARECFLAMGFDETDFDALIDNNVYITKNRRMFTESKLIKMAGNSIVVNVLQAIFIQINDIKKNLFK